MTAAGAAVRPGRTEDLGVVAGLHGRWEAEDNVYGFTGPDPAELERWPGDLFLVAEADGAVVGFLHGVVRAEPALAVIPDGQRYLDVDALYVVPELRRRGVGGRLLDAAPARAAGAGVRHAYVFSAAKDQPAILRFYQRHGLQPWGTQFFR
ncbi:MAG TPA: GNAT family N-acetyltransferase [Dehalococcoidia bacterium]